MMGTDLAAKEQNNFKLAPKIQESGQEQSHTGEGTKTAGGLGGSLVDSQPATLQLVSPYCSPSTTVVWVGVIPSLPTPNKRCGWESYPCAPTPQQVWVECLHTHLRAKHHYRCNR